MADVSINKERATPTVTTKKTAAPGKKKVIRRLVKNAKTGEIIKTEIVRIDSNGHTTVTSYPAGTAVPSLGSLQAAGKQSFNKKSSSRTASPAMESKSETPNETPERNTLSKRGDIGPSVPANLPGLDDLLEREQQLLKAAKEEAKPQEEPHAEDPVPKEQESLESALINLMKKKRMRDVEKKFRRRGLQASTIGRRHDSDSSDDMGEDSALRGNDDADMVNVGSESAERKQEDEDDDDDARRRKEKHRRRREKKYKIKTSKKDNDDDESGIRSMDDDEQDLHPLEEAEILAKKLQAVTALHQRQSEKELIDEERDLEKEAAAEEEALEKMSSDDSEEDDDSDRKKKKKKHKHKKKKKKVKKQKKQRSWSSSDGERSSDKKLSPPHFTQPLNEEDVFRSQDDVVDEALAAAPEKTPRSRTSSYSSMSMESISSEFSDSFDFAEKDFNPPMPPMPMGPGTDFDNAMAEYQRMRGMFNMPRGGFRGRGAFDIFMRGRGAFRGNNFMRGGRGVRGGRGNFRGDMPMDGAPIPPVMGPPGMFMGRGGRGGPFPMRGGPWMGPGVPGGWGRGGFMGDPNAMEDAGIGVHVYGEDSKSKSGSSRSSSYSSYSSRSRHRRRRRRHRSSSRSYSSRSYSRSYSRSSRSSRSYSSSSRSYSSRSSRSSRSRSYSRSSRSRSKSGSAPGWSSSDDNRKRGADRSVKDIKDIYSGVGGANPAKTEDDEEVPWWAEFDKTYEVQKAQEKEAAVQDRSMKTESSSQEVDMIKKDMEVDQIRTLDLNGDDIDVVRTMMSVIDSACLQQDPDTEIARKCLADMIDVVYQQLADEKEEFMDLAVGDCVGEMLDTVCEGGKRKPPPMTYAEQTKSHMDEMDKSDNKLVRCYVRACRVTAASRMKGLATQLTTTKPATDDDDDEGKQSDARSKRSDDGRRGRRRKRRGRRHRRRGRSYSRSSSSASSRGSRDKRPPLVQLTNEQQQSLQQAQQMLIMQQQQLQAAGILPSNLVLPGVPKLPTSNIATPTSTATIEPELLSQRWDKDMEALLKNKNKDDLTRKLMQRMKEKKILEGELSPTFLARTKGNENLPAEKVFVGGGSLKSRKIAISSIDSSKFSKSEAASPGSAPMFDENSELTKDETAAMKPWIGFESNENEKNKENQLMLARLKARSEEQKNMKEEVKRKMREDIEKAERAKKEKMKEEMLEEERQKEIMRIREEVRMQIRKEIQDEIATQRKQVLADPELKSQLMELEALRQSKVKTGGGSAPGASGESKTKDDEVTFADEQDKHKQDMNRWLESYGKQASDMSVDEMRKMQLIYMQQLHKWSQQQQQAYMQWYWHQQQQQHQEYSSQSGGMYNSHTVTNTMAGNEGPSATPANAGGRGRGIQRNQRGRGGRLQTQHQRPNINDPPMQRPLDSNLQQGRPNDNQGGLSDSMQQHAGSRGTPDHLHGAPDQLQNVAPQQDQLHHGGPSGDQMMYTGPPHEQRKPPHDQMVGPPRGQMAPMHDMVGAPRNQQGPPRDQMGMPRDQMAPMHDIAGPQRNQMGPPHDHMGPRDHMGPQRNQMGPQDHMGHPIEPIGHPRNQMAPHHNQMAPHDQRNYGGPPRDQMMYGGPRQDPMMYSGPPRDPMGPPHDQNGPPRDQMGRMGPPREHNMGPQYDQMGPPREQMGIPREQMGIPRDQMGPPRDQMGPPRDQMGPPRDQMPHPPDQIGSRDHMGPPRNQMMYGAPRDNFHHGPHDGLLPTPESNMQRPPQHLQHQIPPNHHDERNHSNLQPVPMQQQQPPAQQQPPFNSAGAPGQFADQFPPPVYPPFSDSQGAPLQTSELQPIPHPPMPPSSMQNMTQQTSQFAAPVAPPQNDQQQQPELIPPPMMTLTPPPPPMQQTQTLNQYHPEAAPEERAPGTTPPPIAPTLTPPPGGLRNVQDDQPPPPGDDNTVLQPPEAKTPTLDEEIDSPRLAEREATPLPVVEHVKSEETKVSKKKKKKHRKHRKRRDRSSSSDDDDDQAQRSAILAQLQAMQNEAKEEGEVDDVEDGEVQSGEEDNSLKSSKTANIELLNSMLKQLESKKKKKRRHREKKRKRRRRRSDSSSDDDEDEPEKSKVETKTMIQHHQQQQPAPAAVPSLPPPPIFHNPTMTTSSSAADTHHLNNSSIMHAVGTPHRRVVAEHRDPPPAADFHHHHQQQQQQRGGEFPPAAAASPYDHRAPPHIEPPPSYSQLLADKKPPLTAAYHDPYEPASKSYGAGEPHRMEHLRVEKFVPGPEGDHMSAMKRQLAKSPLVFADDPAEMERWALRNAEKPRYDDQEVERHIKPLMEVKTRAAEPRSNTPSAGAKRGPSRSENDRSYYGGSNNRERKPSRERRKRGPQGRGRGRKRRRLQHPPRDYHDWDQPEDDGLIYYFSESGSSGWGSDKDFDDLLAKKQRETGTIPSGRQVDTPSKYRSYSPASHGHGQPIHVTNTRRLSPIGAKSSEMRGADGDWDKQLGEVRGIPVIGGSQPQPIPSLANRGGVGVAPAPRPSDAYYRSRYDSPGAGGAPSHPHSPDAHRYVAMQQQHRAPEHVEYAKNHDQREVMHQQQQHQHLQQQQQHNPMPRHMGPSGRLLEPLHPPGRDRGFPMDAGPYRRQPGM